MWAQNATAPGTAFTRSIGDSRELHGVPYPTAIRLLFLQALGITPATQAPVLLAQVILRLSPPACSLAVAEKIGVIAEPEVVSLRLAPSNPFLVIASDGVWEFMSSQTVVNMVGAAWDQELNS